MHTYHSRLGVQRNGVTPRSNTLGSRIEGKRKGLFAAIELWHSFLYGLSNNGFMKYVSAVMKKLNFRFLMYWDWRSSPESQVLSSIITYSANWVIDKTFLRSGSADRSNSASAVPGHFQNGPHRNGSVLPESAAARLSDKGLFNGGGVVHGGSMRSRSAHSSRTMPHR